jgi:hypothetical protein
MYLWIFVGVVSFMLLAAPLGYAQERAQRDDVQQEDPQEGAQQDMGDTDSRSGAGAMSSDAEPANTFLTPNDFLSNNKANPDLDVWRVRCTHNTTICADVFDDQFNDNTFHVKIVCVDPLSRRGKGEYEYAVAPSQNPSPTACVSNCREALVLFQCEFNDFCDSAYNSIIECVNRNFQVLKETQ